MRSLDHAKKWKEYIHTLSISSSTRALAALECNLFPEFCRQLSLLGVVAAVGGAVCLHSSRILAVSDVRVGISRHNHTVERDVNRGREG